MIKRPPGCRPGSIRQQLDMCEEGELRGDTVDRKIEGALQPFDPSWDGGDPIEVDREIGTFEVEMAERDREGDELSGNDHSGGLQGGDAELAGQPHIHPGIPGDEVESLGLTIRREPELSSKKSRRRRSA